MFSTVCLLVRGIAKVAEKSVRDRNHARHGIERITVADNMPPVYAVQQLLGSNDGKKTLCNSLNEAARHRYNGRQFYELLMPAGVLDVLLLWPEVRRRQIVRDSHKKI